MSAITTGKRLSLSLKAFLNLTFGGRKSAWEIESEEVNRKVQKIEIYAIEEFKKIFYHGMSKEDLINGEFENDLRQVLFAGSDEEIQGLKHDINR